MSKLKTVSSLLVTSSLLVSGVSRAGESLLSNNTEGMRHYVSYGAEYYKWDESVDNMDGKYVAEHGPRLRVNFGSNNYLDAREGLLKAWDMSVMFGIVNYRGSTLDDQANVPNGSLKGKTYYTGYSADLTRGYRYRASENVSFDMKGALGGQVWLRNIRSDNVYIASEDRTRRYTAVEVSLQPYAKASLGANWQVTADSRLSLEGGALYPIKTWTHSNQGAVWLEPKSKLSPFTSLTWNINDDVFVKASYVHQKYGKSDEKQGDLNGSTVGYYQPATTTSTLGLEVGFYF
ncbi:hypothetical protein [Rahnella sp. PD12R]|uniref:hypothetical protein n=1 Tax=Rahnella sp. PD12R TaxID=2855688 RepID=UPI00210212B0|nr:hypothetical protein [Rahnella sp. PD12R]